MKSGIQNFHFPHHLFRSQIGGGVYSQEYQVGTGRIPMDGINHTVMHEDKNFRLDILSVALGHLCEFSCSLFHALHCHCLGPFHYFTTAGSIGIVVFNQAFQGGLERLATIVGDIIYKVRGSEFFLINVGHSTMH